MNWVESSHCRSRAHCIACRNERAFRSSIVAKGWAGELDFPCPHGIAWGSQVVFPAPAGPGATLKRILAKAGITPMAHCKCNQRALEMDRRGPDWCERHIDTIVGWLADEAARRRIPFSALAARGLIRMAISLSRRANRISPR